MVSTGGVRPAGGTANKSGRRKRKHKRLHLYKITFPQKERLCFAKEIRLPAVFCQRLFPFSNITLAESLSNHLPIHVYSALTRLFSIASPTLPLDEGRSYLLSTRVETTFHMQKFINHFHPNFCVIFFIRNSIKLVDEFSTTTTL